MFMTPGKNLAPWVFQNRNQHDNLYKKDDEKDIAKLQTHFKLDYKIYTTNS